MISVFFFLTFYTDRVGGRTLTETLKGRNGDDSWDLGGQWVGRYSMDCLSPCLLFCLKFPISVCSFCYLPICTVWVHLTSNDVMNIKYAKIKIN